MRAWLGVQRPHSLVPFRGSGSSSSVIRCFLLKVFPASDLRSASAVTCGCRGPGVSAHGTAGGCLRLLLLRCRCRYSAESLSGCFVSGLSWAGAWSVPSLESPPVTAWLVHIRTGGGAAATQIGRFMKRYSNPESVGEEPNQQQEVRKPGVGGPGRPRAEQGPSMDGRRCRVAEQLSPRPRAQESQPCGELGPFQISLVRSPGRSPALVRPLNSGLSMRTDPLLPRLAAKSLQDAPELGNGEVSRAGWGWGVLPTRVSPTPTSFSTRNGGWIEAKWSQECSGTCGEHFPDQPGLSRRPPGGDVCRARPPRTLGRGSGAHWHSAALG